MSIISNKGKGGNSSAFAGIHQILNGLQATADGMSGISGILNSILNATVAHQDMEILLVRDTGNGDLVVQQVREYDEVSQTWSTSYTDVSGASYVPAGPLEYLDASAVLNLMLTELLDQGINLDNIDLTLTGAVRTPKYELATADGVTVAGVQSISLWFLGDGGTLDGSPVPIGTRVEFEPNKGADTLASIPYTIPTIGATTIIITYVI